MVQAMKRILFSILLAGAAIFMTKETQKPTAARGIRNNNPLNIRKNSTFEWNGEIGRDNAGFVIFDTHENGIRAAMKLMLTYRNKYGLYTVAGIINRWSPPIENDTQSYINNVSSKLGVDPNSMLSLDAYPQLIEAMIYHENGSAPFSIAQINQGVKAAYA